MGPGDRRGGHRSTLLGVAAAALLVTGLGLVGVALAGQTAPPGLPPSAAPAHDSRQPPAGSTAGSTRASGESEPVTGAASGGSTPAAGRTPADRPPTPAVQVAPPVRVVIPSLDITSDLVELGLTRSGEIEAPQAYDRAGWFGEGVRPGDPGAAVIAGHVDSFEGPGIFYRLAALEPGAQVLVEREDGSTATFRVDRLAAYPKDAFPTLEVYATNERELRLITCGGQFRRGHYDDNVVVFASLQD